MTTPAVVEPVPPAGLSSAEQAILAAVAAYLAVAGAAATVHAAASVARLVSGMAAVGISTSAARAALGLALSVGNPDVPVGPGWVASRNTSRAEPLRTASYVLGAARRLDVVLAEGTPLWEALTAERRYLGQHNAARAARRLAANAVDEAAIEHGPLLGWWSVRDDRTTAECRRAHGRNFRADRAPAIGYPGTPHGGTCRCRPGPPHPDGPLLK